MSRYHREGATNCLVGVRSICGYAKICHSSIQITVDLYGHLISGGNKQAIDRLDEPVADRLLMSDPVTPAQSEIESAVGYGIQVLESIWCARQELNLRPAGSKTF